MNKKKLAALVVAAVVLIAVIVLAVQPQKTEKQPEATETAPVKIQIAAEENKDPMTAENKENQEGPTENTEENGTVENNSNKVGISAGSDVESEVDETKSLIPEENVQLGVVEGEGAADLEEEDEDYESAHPAKPTQPKQEQVEEQELPADFEITKLTYEQYNAMSGAQQRQVIEMFASVEEFMKWYRAVEAKYQAEHPDIEIGADGVINAEDLIK